MREVGHNVREVAYKGVMFKLYVAKDEDTNKKWVSVEARIIDNKDSNWKEIGTEQIQ